MLLFIILNIEQPRVSHISRLCRPFWIKQAERCCRRLASNPFAARLVVSLNSTPNMHVQRISKNWLCFPPVTTKKITRTTTLILFLPDGIWGVLVWRVSLHGGCLEGIWRAFLRCLEGVQKVSEMCLESTLKVSERFLENV